MSLSAAEVKALSVAMKKFQNRRKVLSNQEILTKIAPVGLFGAASIREGPSFVHFSEKSGYLI